MEYVVRDNEDDDGFASATRDDAERELANKRGDRWWAEYAPFRLIERTITERDITDEGGE